MKANNDPLRLDVAALAASGTRLSGTWPVRGLSRLSELCTEGEPGVPREVSWAALGERRTPHAAAAQTWLHLSAHTTVGLTCQRCLAPLEHALTVERPLRFVASEAEAEALDAESEEDVLELPRRLDLIELIEDELLLALPLVPMHRDCPAPLVMRPSAQSSEEAPAAHPFAGLKAWKAPGSEH
jgi:uncharacterized protein